MAALTTKRVYRPHRAKTIELACTNQQVYQGGIACFDTSTGLVAKAAPSTTMIPIGVFTEDKLVTGNAAQVIELFRELEAAWFPNATAGDAVVAATIGSLCYLLDDQTVAQNDATNTRSVAGRVWKIDTTKGVLVEFRQTAGDRLGGLDA
jgi:hypothetical protein